MRVLIASTAGSGHFAPMVPFAAAVRDAGHAVRVAAPASFAATIRRAGFDHVPLADAPPEELGSVFARLPSLSMEAANAVVVSEVFGDIDTRAALPGMQAGVDAWRPDLILRETAEFSSYLVAERNGIPHAQLSGSQARLEEFMQPLVEQPLRTLGSQRGWWLEIVYDHGLTCRMSQRSGGHRADQTGDRCHATRLDGYCARSVLVMNAGIALERRVPLPIYPVVLLALAKLVLHLITNAQYGYQRDELYYLASGLHPAFGYVDYPPVTPMLARFDEQLLGNLPWMLRLMPSVVGASLVVLVALIAREIGGGRRAQILAAVAAASSLLLLGSNWLFQTVTFDELCWIATIYVFARLLRSGDARLWVAIGGLLGIGLETKLTIVGLGMGLVAALILTPLRQQLRTPWPWVGCLLALVLWTPNLIWQQLNGWPTLEFLRGHGEVIQAAAQGSLALNFDSGGMLAFVTFQPVLIGVVTLPLWIMGWYFLFRHARWRPLGVTALVAFVVYLPVGKAYYPGPLIPVLLAAGCVQLEAIACARHWTRLPALAAAAMVLQALVALPLLIPVVPQSSLASFGLDQARKDYADTVGWPELVAQVASVYQQLSPAEQQSTAIVAGNYGEAGAIDLYGPAMNLPQAISPHLTFWYWKPSHVDAQTVITVGIAESDVRPFFADVTRVDVVQAVDGVQSEEVGRAILLCRQPRVPLDDVWPNVRRFY